MRRARRGVSVTVRAPAKINLYLGVGAPREDGYHPLATVYQAVGLYDDVTVVPADQWSVEMRAESHVDAGSVPADGHNIAIKAGRALAAHHRIPGAARIEIHKGIPVAGGMAGGSADAAATLVALDRMWDLHTSDADLLAIAAALGSDVPFALLGGTASGHGRGEVVLPLPDNGHYWWVAVFNRTGLSTPEVYRHYDVVQPSPARPAVPMQLRDALVSGDVNLLAAALHNDLADAALDLRPDLRDTALDAEKAGARAVLLSGSGPTMLLLAADAAEARSVAGAMRELGHDRLAVVPGPVPGAHVLTYD